SAELVHGPPGEMLADRPCGEAQPGAAEGSVIADPAPDLRVDLVREAGQVRATAAVEVPVPDLPAFRLLRLAADSRVEAGEVTVLPFGQAAPEGIAGEIKAGVPGVSRAVRVRAVRDLRLRGMRLQARGPGPPGDGSPQPAGPVLAVAVRDNA